MTLTIILFFIGLFLLYFGAEWLVKGSSDMARSAGLSPIVIGLTVVAFGTSAPETFVSVVSSFKDKSMIAVGNVIGSNICNIALIMGLAAVFRPIASQPAVIRRDIPIMMAISVYLLIVSFNSVITRVEGATLFGGVILYTLFNYYMAKRELQLLLKRANMDSSEVFGKSKTTASRGLQVVMVVAGIAGVVGGAELVIDTAIKIMAVLGVSERFIGLTIVAFGTSLPELATSVVAAWKDEMDISVGNLVGSNVFNILCVIGAASLVRPIRIPGGFVQSGLIVDYLVMMMISVLPWIMMRITFKITRAQGFFLLACYGGYLTYLIIRW